MTRPNRRGSTPPVMVDGESAIWNKLRTQFSTISKKMKLGTYSLTSTHNDKLSTNLLVVDLVLGGGIVPGGWYTLFGLEQSAKSTLQMQIALASLKQNINYRSLWDYEGSTVPDYLDNIMRNNRIRSNIDQVFGITDESGKVVVPGKIEYFSEIRGETFFDYNASVLRSMPDKKHINGKWWLLFEDNKYGRGITDGKHDHKIKQETGMLGIPSENGFMQGLILCDSYPAMLPESLDEDDPSHSLAMQARMFSENVPRMTGRLRSKRVTVIGVNQLREKPAVRFGNPEYEPCGNALKFASSCRIKLTPRAVPVIGGKFEEEESISGNGKDVVRYIHLRAEKNKLSTPYIEGWARLLVQDHNGNSCGFDHAYDCYQYLVMTGQVSGSRKKGLTILLPEFENSKPVKWTQFKSLTVGTKEQASDTMLELGLVKRNSKPDPINLRSLLHKQSDTGVGMQKMLELRANQKVDNEG